MAKTNKKDRKPVSDPKKAGFPSTEIGQPSGNKRSVVVPKDKPHPKTKPK
jgi:hypothetical protein